MNSLARRIGIGAYRNSKGFSLTEMLVTTLVVAAMSAMLATGVPVAIDTYHKTVSVANAQVALSTTTAALRRELSLAADVRVSGSDNTKIYYLSRNEGCWIYIASADPTSDCKGLEKWYLTGVPMQSNGVDGLTLAVSNERYIHEPLIPNETIPDDLRVTFDSVSLASQGVTFHDLDVFADPTRPFAAIENYSILTRFEDPDTR